VQFVAFRCTRRLTRGAREFRRIHVPLESIHDLLHGRSWIQVVRHDLLYLDRREMLRIADHPHCDGVVVMSLGVRNVNVLTINLTPAVAEQTGFA
jgi:hypothetical protein